MAPPADIHDVAPPAPASDDVRAFLARVRRLLCRRDAARSALWAIGALSLVALAMPLAGLAAVGPRSTAAAILAGGGTLALLILVGALLLGVVIPRRRWRPDAAVARWVGEREPTIASDLLSTVELEDAPARRGAPSAALVGALVDATAQRIRALSAPAMVPSAPVRLALLGCAGALALHAGVALAARSTLADGWHRLLHRPRPPFDGAAVTPTPLVGDLTVTLDAPAYARRPRTVLPSSSGEFRAMRGTEVTLETHALAPVTAAVVLLEPTDGGAPRTVDLDVGDDGVLRGRFTVDGELTYRFEVTRPDHHRAVEMTARTVEIEPDAAPTVQLLAPGDDLDVTSMRRIELGITAEDDHGIAKVELVWNDGHETTRKPLDLLEVPGVQATVQAKWVWDLADVSLPPGARVAYHVEVTDGDTVGGPNVGSSRELRLRVFSPRERHEQTLARQEETAEKLLRVLAGRLGLGKAGGDDLAARDELRRVGAEVVVELGTLVAAYEKDPQADKKLRTDLEAMRGRLDKLASAEGKLLDRARKDKHPGARLAAVDKQVVAELEDDVIALADWLDRERMESLLDVSDEIAAHRKRIAELMEQYAKTGDPRLKAEIDRELRALQQRLAELAQKRTGMTADVLDQFVNADAMKDQQADGCIDQVRALFAAGKTDEAQAKLAECSKGLDAAQSAMESALEQLRGDRFGAEQQKLDGLMNELSDLAQDQKEIAADADKIFDRYADRADELMHDLGKEAKKKLQSTVDKLRQRVDDVPSSGLTPFAQEELDIVSRRLDDLEHMLDDGDIAEALGMARQAKQSLDTVSAELEAALEDDPRSAWAGDTRDALDAVERAHPQADKLVDELQALAPSPDQILDDDDKKALDKLRRRQGAAQDKAKKLADKARSLGPELPGQAGDEISGRVDEGGRHMDEAARHMKGRDPSAARDAARQASDALEKAQEKARSAARQQMSDGGAGLENEPIKIPGADEYKAPAHFREDILEAMKKQAPEGYDEMVKQYYQELIR